MLNVTLPLSKDIIRQLHAGDEVLLTGTVYTARDQAHKRLHECLAAKEPLPFELEGQLIYYVGPTPSRPEAVIGAAGPTTSSRMDAFTPELLEKGLAGTIGKGYRSQEVIDSLQKNTAVHFSAYGGAGALLGQCIKSCEVIAYDDLGTEAIRKIYVESFPAVVAYDCYGQNVYPEPYFGEPQ
ncbi:Fumarate hydratase class I, aerobic [Limihaloglobus sulfuriphilus]|uniref:Fumarate hydratase class I, aerobic n=1 Tax=Limihaloglobus sulfuriphilus TaxID=1851148 RepID=A0A1Q2MBS4_9BACT|nr:Fe-S-containing hydro-lyase [Limihaloglobus sulfuriphilus]AQQ70110.1 Fumarate hydratase class I, aerobic [Limihaloglobus sulfuriphilus]